MSLALGSAATHLFPFHPGPQTLFFNVFDSPSELFDEPIFITVRVRHQCSLWVTCLLTHMSVCMHAHVCVSVHVRSCMPVGMSVGICEKEAIKPRATGDVEQVTVKFCRSQKCLL